MNTEKELANSKTTKVYYQKKIVPDQDIITKGYMFMTMEPSPIIKRQRAAQSQLSKRILKVSEEIKTISSSIGKRVPYTGNT